MPMEGRSMKGCRPSRYGGRDTQNEEADIVRLSNLEVYSARARQGLPIFDEQQQLSLLGRRVMHT